MSKEKEIAEAICNTQMVKGFVDLINKENKMNRKTFATLGPSNHCENERQEDDFYATDPEALRLLLDVLKHDKVELNKKIWEPAAGLGHLSEVLIKAGYEVRSTDIIDRGYCEGGIDFLSYQEHWDGDILTNPPFKYAEGFVRQSMHVLEPGNKLLMFLKIQFLEGKQRRMLFEEFPPKYVYVNSQRQVCAKDGDFNKYNSSAMCLCWFIWEKGSTSDPILRWI